MACFWGRLWQVYMYDYALEISEHKYGQKHTQYNSQGPPRHEATTTEAAPSSVGRGEQGGVRPGNSPSRDRLGLNRTLRLLPIDLGILLHLFISYIKNTDVLSGLPPFCDWFRLNTDLLYLLPSLHLSLSSHAHLFLLLKCMPRAGSIPKPSVWVCHSCPARPFRGSVLLPGNPY